MNMHNILREFFFHYLGICLEMELLDHVFDILKNYQNVFQSGYTMFYISTSTLCRFQILHILANTYFLMSFLW